jgi:sialate O-acetylesterase
MLEGPFKTMKKSAKASSEGLWEVTFSPLKAAVGITLTVEGKKDKLVYNDVAAGDVWVCSGQSNMFFRVYEGLEIGETPADSNLRLYNMRPKYYVNDERWPDEAIANTLNMDFYHPTEWVACDGQNMKDFSAVGYHFGAMLR